MSVCRNPRPRRCDARQLRPSFQERIQGDDRSALIVTDEFDQHVEDECAQEYAPVPARANARTRNSRCRAKPRSQGKRRGSGAFSVSFANITSLSDKANFWLTHNTSDVLFAVETHFDPTANSRGARILRNYLSAGWMMTCGLPQRSLSTRDGSYGGVLAGVKRHLSFTQLDGLVFHLNA